MFCIAAGSYQMHSVRSSRDTDDSVVFVCSCLFIRHTYYSVWPFGVLLVSAMQLQLILHHDIS